MADIRDLPPDASTDQDESLDWALAARYLAGECAPAEAAMFEAWMAERASRQHLLNELRTTWTGAWDPSTHAVTADDAEAAWRSARAHLTVGAPYARLWWPARITALVASCVMLLGLGVVWQRHGVPSAVTAYVTARGEQRVVRLADGTRVVLAPASRLRVTGHYGARDRTVDLDGEAYFTVVHDTWHPFAVRAGGATITDVGTEFDVRDYSTDPNVRIAVTQGQVVVGAASLRPGDVAHVTAAGVVVSRGIDVAALTAWTQGRLVFKETPLSEVVRDLARTFDLDITVADSTLLSTPITASFDVESDDQILGVVTRIIGAHYDRNGHKVVIRPGVSTAKQSPVPAIHTTQVFSSLSSRQP